MKLRILSDIHTEGYNFIYERLDEDVLVLAGDIGVGDLVVKWIKFHIPIDLPVIFVPGNHEYYNRHFENTNALFESEFAGTNVRYLNNSQAIIDGVRFLGSTMHSNFGLFGESERWSAEQASKGINDFYCIKTAFTNRSWTVSDCKKEFDKFERYMEFKLKHDPFQGKTVIVTHFCPSAQSVHERFKQNTITPFFASNCEHLMGFSDLWIHGHTHDCYDYVIEGTRVICNPRGYGRENETGFNRNLIVEI